MYTDLSSAIVLSFDMSLGGASTVIVFLLPKLLVQQTVEPDDLKSETLFKYKSCQLTGDELKKIIRI